MTRFDREYWVNTGARYRDEFRPGPAYDAQEAALVDVLGGISFDSVLEIGCGFGRLTRLVAERFKPARYIATDLNAEMTRQAFKHAGAALPGDAVFQRLELDELSQMLAEENVEEIDKLRADLVLAGEVLMHRRPDQVERDVDALAALASNYVVTVDWHMGDPYEAEGCYVHDYEALFAPYGAVIRTDVPAARQAIFRTWIGAVEQSDDPS